MLPGDKKDSYVVTGRTAALGGRLISEISAAPSDTREALEKSRERGGLHRNYELQLGQLPARDVEIASGRCTTCFSRDQLPFMGAANSQERSGTAEGNPRVRASLID